MSHLLQTYTGKMIDIINPTPDMIDIRDIARGLAFTCRYGGQCPSFYSVAEHSLLVSDHCFDEFTLWGLLHDAPEAYLGDICSPVKQLVPIFKECEDKLMAVIAEKYSLSGTEIPPSVKSVDNRMLMTEVKYMGMDEISPEFWKTKKNNKKYDQMIYNWRPDLAEYSFLTRAKELGIEFNK